MSLLTDLIENAIQTRIERGMLVEMPRGDATTPVVPAAVYQSRWLVKCPWCAGATIMDPNDLRFFCADCCNAGAGFRYVPVYRRPDWREVMAQLMKRPDPQTRNCLPHESLDDLIAEDRAHGIV